jgi:hypothetical protein
LSYALSLEIQSCFAPHYPTQNSFALLLEMLWMQKTALITEGGF